MKDDAGFNELKLHWIKLHALADQARASVHAAFALMDGIDNDPDLSPQGRQRKKCKAAIEMLAEMQNSKALTQAQEAVKNVMAKWDKMRGLLLKQPDDAPSAILAWEIRDRFASLKDERERMSFLERFGAEVQVASALSNGPAGLTNLSEAEHAMLRSKIEQHMDPTIREAREKTAKGLAEAEQGFKRAQAVIAQRGGLRKSVNGSWSLPTEANAAA